MDCWLKFSTFKAGKCMKCMKCMKEKQQSLPEFWVHPAGHLRIVRDVSVGTFGVLMSKSSRIAQPALQAVIA